MPDSPNAGELMATALRPIRLSFLDSETARNSDAEKLVDFETRRSRRFRGWFPWKDFRISCRRPRKWPRAQRSGPKIEPRGLVPKISQPGNSRGHQQVVRIECDRLKVSAPWSSKLIQWARKLSRTLSSADQTAITRSGPHLSESKTTKKQEPKNKQTSNQTYIGGHQ